MNSLEGFSSYMPSGWSRGSSVPPSPVASHKVHRGINLAKFHSRHLEALAASLPEFAQRQAGNASNEFGRLSNSERFLMRSRSECVDSGSTFSLRSWAVSRSKNDLDVGRTVSVELDPVHLEWTSRLQGRSEVKRYVFTQALTTRRAAPPTTLLARTGRATLTARASAALGAHGSARVAAFRVMKAGWDDGKGATLSAQSLLGLNRFFDLAPSDFVYSVFMTHAGNLSLGWRDHLGCYAEVEFVSTESFEYFLERTDEEGAQRLTDAAVQELFAAEDVFA